VPFNWLNDFAAHTASLISLYVCCNSPAAAVNLSAAATAVNFARRPTLFFLAARLSMVLSYLLMGSSTLAAANSAAFAPTSRSSGQNSIAHQIPADSRPATAPAY